MSTVPRQGLIALAAACLLAAQPAAAQGGRRGNLVDVGWLTAHRSDPTVLILDASSARTYAAGHIPGAVNVDLYAYGVAELAAAELDARYRSWGIDARKEIVLYDEGAGMMATRTFYDLYYHGFPARNLLVLDGGLGRWQAEGLPIAREATALPGNGTFKVRVSNEDVRARLPEFLAASGDPAHNALVEGLGPDWHFGEVLAFERAGHIPNAIMLPAADFYGPDKTFKSPVELRKMLDYLGIRPEQQIYTVCGGGVAASVPFFALKFLLGYPRVKLFPESEMGWLADERGLPYWTYDAPYLMRQSNWLRWSGGQVIRMYLGARVSIVDVRSPEAYRQGHLPFALNVPPDVFRGGLTAPEQLAAALGAAGVDPAQEAVLVSGAGVTTQSALAFLLMEELGQKRASLFLDSMSGWARLGLPLSQQATVVGPKKGPRDLSIPPVAYPDHTRRGVLLTQAPQASGPYPTVFIAAGAQVPASAPAGKVVHVPYTDLLDGTGAPKRAQDLWKILSAAGVPRYGQLVCFSADPGEAAVDYFVLRLMGYPDVKVLVL